MAKARKKPAFWRRRKPKPEYDIALLRPPDKPKGQRFETLPDARQESERSEQLLRSFAGAIRMLADYLQECRAGDYECQKPFCPICAGRFRRWFIGELLRVSKRQDPVHIYTVLLKEAPKDKIDTLDPAPFKHALRKQLERAGSGSTSDRRIEIAYKAREAVWVLHAESGDVRRQKAARKKFRQGFKQATAFERPVMKATLKIAPKQLSYILKFSTYHRPYEQHGSAKAKAKPLNPKEHAALVKWMSQFEFQDFLLLITTQGVREAPGLCFHRLRTGRPNCSHDLDPECMDPLVPLVALFTGKDRALN